MNLTQEVVTDLLPIYFSGEASSGTKSLVEEYFRDHPDFERIAPAKAGFSPGPRSARSTKSPPRTMTRMLNDKTSVSIRSAPATAGSAA